ncbi:HTH domain-containing protein [Eubacterium limosum]|nr:HTH domain-containing protein [Eubacterium limosum]
MLQQWRIHSKKNLGVILLPEACANIIDQLVEQRKQQHLSQTELAKKANMTQSVIARIESKKTVPQIDTLMKIIMALGCTLEVVPRKN